MSYKFICFLSLIYGCYIPAFQEYSYTWKIIGDLPNSCMIESFIDSNGSLINLYVLNQQETEYIYNYFSIDYINNTFDNMSLVIEIYSNPKSKPDISKTFIKYISPYNKFKEEKYFFYSSFGNWIKVNDIPLRVKEGKFHVENKIKYEPLKLFNNFLITEVNLEFYLGINFDKFIKNKRKISNDLFNKPNFSFQSCLN